MIFGSNNKNEPFSAGNFIFGQSNKVGFVGANVNSSNTTQNTIIGEYNEVVRPASTGSGGKNIVIGSNLIATGSYNTVIGFNNTVYSVGSSNVSPNQRRFVVGNGTSVLRSDAFIIYNSGEIIAPSLEMGMIDSEVTGKILTTKEWVLSKVTGGSVTSNQYNQNNITFKNVVGDYFGTLAAPRTGTLTFDNTDAVGGAISTVWYLNNTLDIPSVWVTKGTFDTAGVNKLYFERGHDGTVICNIVNTLSDVPTPTETAPSIDVIEQLPIVNGSFSGASIANWTEQSATISFEVFDGKSAVKIESSGGYTRLKQSVATVIGTKYVVRALLHDANSDNHTGLVIYDTDLQATTIGAAQDSLIIQAHTITASNDWKYSETIFTAISDHVTISIREFGGGVSRVNIVE